MKRFNARIRKSTTPSISRRDFLSAAAGAAAFTVLPRYVLGGNGYEAGTTAGYSVHTKRITEGAHE